MTTPEEPSESRERVWVAAGALVGVVVAGVVLAVTVLLSSKSSPAPTEYTPGSSSTSTSGGPATKTAAIRDESLKAAESAVVVVNTLDYKALDQGLDQWESVAASPLLDDLKAKRGEASTAATKAKSSSTAKLLAAAVATIAADGNSTDVLASVEVTTTEPKGGPAVRQLRFKLTMSATPQGWKLSAVTPVEPPA